MTALREVLARRDANKTEKYLVIVATHDGPVPNAEIRRIARDNGWRDGASSSPAAFLNASPRAILLPNGWTVTKPGLDDLEKRGLISAVGILTPITEALERYLLDISDSDKARFVEEAILCVRNKAYRSAIVLTWVGAVYLLYDHIVRTNLRAFNAEAKRRQPKWKDAADIDDLSSIKEAEFLNILEHIRVLTNAEHKELKGCLDRRNTAGHPNSHSFEEVTVGAHVQALISSVYKKF